MPTAASHSPGPFTCDQFTTGHLTHPGVLSDPSGRSINVLPGDLGLDRDEPWRGIVSELRFVWGDWPLDDSGLLAAFEESQDDSPYAV